MSTPTAKLGADAVLASGDITVRELTSADMPAASDLLGAVWQRSSGSPMDVPMLVALAHGGNYVAGAFRDDSMVGVCAAFFATPIGDTLHSHIAGVLPDQAGRGVGAALKKHQWAWARAHGLAQITWTFDPLIARNAYFNFHRLGVQAVEYVENFYGDLLDGLNNGEASDRLLVSWSTEAPVPTGDTSDEPPVSLLGVTADGRPLDGGPPPPGARSCAVSLPADVEDLRRTRPEVAREWRHALRGVLAGLLDDGWEVVDVERAGRYILRRS